MKISCNRRIIQSFGLEENLKGIWFQLPCHGEMCSPFLIYSDSIIAVFDNIGYIMTVETWEYILMYLVLHVNW